MSQQKHERANINRDARSADNIALTSAAGIASRRTPERQAAHREPPHESAASRLVRREHCCAVSRHLVQHLAHVARHVHVTLGTTSDERMLQQSVVLGPLQLLLY